MRLVIVYRENPEKVKQPDVATCTSSCAEGKLDKLAYGTRCSRVGVSRQVYKHKQEAYTEPEARFYS